MRNLKPYDGNSFEFHKNIIDRKRNTKEDATYKLRISALNGNVEDQYTLYDTHFGNDTLQNLTQFGYTGQEKNDLLALYSYKSKLLQDLKTKLTTTETNRIINACQNCTINEINSFDHFVPKDEFAEFSVNPKNLFPSCTMCNGYKAVAWRESGQRVFLNLYLDALPQEQYLFVDLDISGDDIKTNFRVANPNNIEPQLFRIIQNHYAKLRLCKRFTDNNDEVITALKNDVESHLDNLSVEVIQQTVIKRNQKNMLAFGHNYWKSILELALINSVAFWKIIAPGSLREDAATINLVSD
jgi:hypothetical protein